jgi:drug/metabolite transporter (DMT)-like permease
MLGAYLKLTLAPILWGGALVAGRVVAADLPPITITWIRFLLVSVFLLPVLRLYEGRFPRPGRSDWLLLAMLSLSGVVVFNLLLFSGLKTVSAARSSVLIALGPAVVAAAMMIFFREAARWNTIVGILTAFLGAVITIANGKPAAILAGGLAAGDAYLLGCVLSWAAYTILARSAMQALSAMAVLTYSSILGTVLLTPFAVRSGLPAALAGYAWSTWACLIYLSFGAAGLAYLCYYIGIREVGPSKAAVFLNLEPVSAILLGVLLLGETLTWPVWVGGGMVIAGLYLVNRPPSTAIARRRRISRERRVVGGRHRG